MGEEENEIMIRDGDDQPPIISWNKNDAARIMAGLDLDSSEGGNEGNTVVSCNWGPIWGLSSVRTKEVTNIASQQDIVGEP